jgi:hypothetical protein
MIERTFMLQMKSEDEKIINDNQFTTVYTLVALFTLHRQFVSEKELPECAIIEFKRGEKIDATKEDPVCLLHCSSPTSTTPQGEEYFSRKKKRFACLNHESWMTSCCVG